MKIIFNHLGFRRILVVVKWLCDLLRQRPWFVKISLTDIARFGFSPFFLTHFIDQAQIEDLNVVWQRIVTPPSLIPQQYGNRVKTDRLDSRKLAQLLA